MKNIGNELYAIIEMKKLVKKEIAEKIGITPVYLSAIMRKKSIDCGLLEKICKAIGVSPAYFFDDYAGNAVIPQYSDNSEKFSQNERKLLLQLLEEKERTIKILLDEKNKSQDL